MSGGSGSGLHRDRTGLGGSRGRLNRLLAVIPLTVAVVSCSSVVATPNLQSDAAATIAATPVATRPTEPGFAPTGNMVSPDRGYHTATLLDDGRVLIAGGQTVEAGPVTFFASAELYDSSAGTFKATGSMAEARESDTATLLRDGRVLIAGGQNDQMLDSAELYDPKTGQFTATGSMSAPRENHTATLLADGRVLVAGGDPSGGDDQTPLATAEIYDPKSGSFSATGSMIAARKRAGSAVLADGRVLIVGGEDAQLNTLATAETYDPKSGSFSPTGSMLTAQSAMAVIALREGRVLVVGSDPAGSPAAELYDPVKGTFSAAGYMAVQGLDTAVLLDDGRVLVIGGYFAGATGNGSADLYDPSANTFGPAGTMTSPRLGQSATVLADGRVLVAGGAVDASAEVYTAPAPHATITPTPAPTLALPGELATLPVTSIAADQIHRTTEFASTDFGALVYSIAGTDHAMAEVTVTDLSTGAGQTVSVRLPANEIVPGDSTQVYAATDGRYLVVYASHPYTPPGGPVGIPSCVRTGDDWQLLVAHLDPATGLPSGDFTVFASGVMKRVFNAPRAGEAGNCWSQNTVFAVDGGMITYTVDDVTSARPMGSRIILRSLATGSTLRSVVATEMVYEVHLSGTTIAWAESQNISTTGAVEQARIRVSTAANPAPLDVASGPDSGARDLPAVRLVGDEISWDGLGNTSVWYRRIDAGSPQSLTPAGLACLLAGSTPGHVVVYCTWIGTDGSDNRSPPLVATIGAGLRRVEGLPSDAWLRPTISNGWFVDAGGQTAYQPVARTYALPVTAIGM